MSKNEPTQYDTGRSQQYHPSQSEHSDCDHQSTLEALFAAHDESILQAVEKQIANTVTNQARKRKYYETKENFSKEFETDLNSSQPSQYRELSTMDCEPKTPLDYSGFIVQDKDEPMTDSFMEDENQWQNHSLFNQAITEPEFNDLSDFDNPLILTPCSPQSERLSKWEMGENVSKFQSQLSSTSDDFVFDDTSLWLDKEEEFSFVQKAKKSKETFKTEVNQEICNEKAGLQPGEYFYGLPDHVKTLIQRTKNIESLYSRYLIYLRFF